MWNLVRLSIIFLGSTLAMTSSIIASWIFLLEISSACWVETTTVSIRTGRPFRYSIVTWLLPSGRSQG